MPEGFHPTAGALLCAVLGVVAVMAGALAVAADEEIRVFVPDPYDHTSSCIALQAKLSGQFTKWHDQLGRSVEVPFSPSHGYIRTEGLCRDNTLEPSALAAATQHLTVKFLPMGLDGGRYFWLLEMTFRLGEGENSDKWHLHNYTLRASYPRPNPHYDSAAFMQMQKPSADNTSATSSDNGEWPLIPVGKGFACSRLELPVISADRKNNATIVLTDLRAVAFAPGHLLPTAELSNTDGRGLPDLAGVEWDYCAADGSSWPKIALYGGLGLAVVLLGCLLFTVLMVYCRGERRGRTHVCNGEHQSGCCL